MTQINASNFLDFFELLEYFRDLINISGFPGIIFNPKLISEIRKKENKIGLNIDQQIAPDYLLGVLFPTPPTSFRFDKPSSHKPSPNFCIY
jgi:hypothetical protein